MMEHTIGHRKDLFLPYVKFLTPLLLVSFCQCLFELLLFVQFLLRLFNVFFHWLLVFEGIFYVLVCCLLRGVVLLRAVRPVFLVHNCAVCRKKEPSMSRVPSFCMNELLLIVVIC